MTRTIALLSILLTPLVSAEDLLPLGSDNYTMEVTEEVAHPKVGHPSEKIPNDEYRPAKEQKTLSLRFSKDRQKVEILPRGVSGELTSADANKRVYLLSKGLLAGGRLIVERTKTGLLAVFTEFGSGVPVISSKRGGIDPVARNIVIAKAWLDQLRDENGELSEVLAYMASEINFDGQISSEKDQIRKKVLEMRRALTSPPFTVKFSDFQSLDRIRIEQLMTNSKHSRKYKLSQDVIDSMVLFRLHTGWRGEVNVDGVFLGFDSNRKIVSCFD